MQAKSDRNNGPFHWLEKRLWRSGVQDPTIREILCWQISVIALSLLFGAVLWPFHPAGAWIFWFGFGALLSAWNFFALIKFVPKVISAGWSKSSLFALLLRTNMRLLFTGILLYMVLVWFKGSISAVLLGLAVLLVGMTAGGLKGIEKAGLTGYREPAQAASLFHQVSKADYRTDSGRHENRRVRHSRGRLFSDASYA